MPVQESFMETWTFPISYSMIRYYYHVAVLKAIYIAVVVHSQLGVNDHALYL